MTYDKASHYYASWIQFWIFLSTGNLSHLKSTVIQNSIYICTVSSCCLLCCSGSKWCMDCFGQSNMLSKLISAQTSQEGIQFTKAYYVVGMILLSWRIYCDYNLPQQIREHRNSLRKKIVRSLLWTEFSIPSILLYSRWFGSGDIATHNGHLGVMKIVIVRHVHRF